MVDATLSILYFRLDFDFGFLLGSSPLVFLGSTYVIHQLALMCIITTSSVHQCSRPLWLPFQFQLFLGHILTFICCRFPSPLSKICTFHSTLCSVHSLSNLSFVTSLYFKIQASSIFYLEFEGSVKRHCGLYFESFNGPRGQSMLLTQLGLTLLQYVSYLEFILCTIERDKAISA